MLGNDHLSNTSAKVITIKTLFASAKPSAIANCWGEFQGLEVWPTQKYNYVLKMSWWHMAKMNILVLMRTSSEDIWLRQICLSGPRCLEDVFKMSSEDKDQRRLQDVFIKTNVWWVLLIVLYQFLHQKLSIFITF